MHEAQEGNVNAYSVICFNGHATQVVAIGVHS